MVTAQTRGHQCPFPRSLVSGAPMSPLPPPVTLTHEEKSDHILVGAYHFKPLLLRCFHGESGEGMWRQRS